MAVILREANGRFATVQKLIDSLQNPRPLLEIVGQILKQRTKQRITTTKIDPTGRQWKPWSYSTFIARARKGNVSRGVLYDSGNLLNSITYQVSGKQVVVGVNSGMAPYAVFLQNGTPNMPARPFIGISKDDNDAVRTAVKNYLAAKKN